MAREIGSLVWSARDPADFADILDAQANDEQAYAAARKVAGTLYAGGFRKIPFPRAFVRQVRAKVLDDSSVATDMLEGLRTSAVISGLLGKHPPMAPGQEGGEKDLDAVDLYDAPIPILNAVLAHARGTTCLAALVDLALSDRGPLRPRWLAEGVARGWVDGDRSMIRLLASVYEDADVPADLVPSDQRIGRERMRCQHNEGEAVFEALISQMSNVL
jgi:hypothetical protein